MARFLARSELSRSSLSLVVDEAARYGFGFAGGRDDKRGEYIERSRHAARRRQRTLVGALAIGLLIAIGLAVAAVIQRGDAITNNRHAQEAEDDDQALLDLSTDPAHAVSAALAAVSERFSQARDVELRQAMMGDQLRGYLTGQHGVTALAFDPADDAVLVAGGDGGAARVRTRRSQRASAPTAPGSSPRS
jgi:hypothetical protein